MASNLKPGLALPRIALPATTGGEIFLAALPGLAVIIVYPWTGRPGHPNPPNWDNIEGAHGSTPELEGFRDLADDFAKLNVRLFALSRQTTAYQREMVERLGLPFPVLSDATGHFAGPLALPGFATGGETYLKRLTLVASQGTIKAVFFPVPDPVSHAGDVLSWLRSQRKSSSASSTE